ncbi:hypothetical protein LCGC14_1995890 [marine sediment metagenome]|uniref:Uncharacterized protein n=1 Tax=marine sediment metagenome TaxID=412755 RepID=A0A0F9F4Y7_9ZZZZ
MIEILKHMVSSIEKDSVIERIEAEAILEDAPTQSGWMTKVDTGKRILTVYYSSEPAPGPVSGGV